MPAQFSRIRCAFATKYSVSDALRRMLLGLQVFGRVEIMEDADHAEEEKHLDDTVKTLGNTSVNQMNGQFL